VEEVVDARAELADRGPDARRIGHERQPLGKRLAREESDREQAQLRAREEHDLGAALTHPLGASGAVDEERE
jgi:hypothetical protein